jgi:hypothetical protein
MPLKKLQLKPGVNRENTRYTTEGGWYSCDKIRFRQGTPEKIGGWQQITNDQFLGICRSLWTWATNTGVKYVGLGTHLKYYIALANGGTYNDVTPLRKTVNPMLGPNPPGTGNPFAGNGTTTVTVTDVAHGGITGDFVTYTGSTDTLGPGGTSLFNAEYQITVVDGDLYTITVSTSVSAGSYGGAAVVAAYQISVGDAIQNTLTGWGAGGWGLGGWGVGATSTTAIRIWNHYNFGKDLIYGPKNGPMYYWDATTGTGTRGVALTSLAGASDVPTVQSLLLVSDTSRFVLAFGCNDYGSVTQDAMLIRWSDQETAVNWTPAATNQAGSLRLSHGSAIQAIAQVRQEVLVWTDTALYSMQYLGPPVVWGSQMLADNTSIISDRAWATAAGVTYWMGDEKFYAYDGRLQTLVCDLRQYVFTDFNYNQTEQVFCSTNEQFTEVWWFYCSANSTTVDRYVIYNYTEKVWYYGTMARTAWVDTTIASNVPMATDYNSRLLYQETGVDDNATTTTQAIEAYITSSEFDIDDGHNFAFIWRVLPDANFVGSTTNNPTMYLTLLPLQNSGSGYNNPESVGGTNVGSVIRSATVPVEQFTQQVNLRVRGRQMSIKASSTAIGTQWQLGSPRIDIRPDGRKS